MQRKAPSKAALRHCENQVQRFAPKCVDSFFRLFQFGTLFANQRKKELILMKSLFEEMGGTYRQEGDYLSAKAVVLCEYVIHVV